MPLDDLNVDYDELVAICKRYQVLKLELFGSRARGNARAHVASISGAESATVACNLCHYLGICDMTGDLTFQGPDVGLDENFIWIFIYQPINELIDKEDSLDVDL